MTTSQDTSTSQISKASVSKGSSAGISGADLSITRLVELLERQSGIYSQLREYTAQQGSLIAQGLTEPLLSLLAKRQQLIDELGGIDSDLGPFKHNWQRLLQSIDTAKRKRVEQLVGQIETDLQVILKQDEADQQQLNNRFSQMGTQIRKVTSGGVAVKAYGAAENRSGQRFTDQQG